MTITGNQAFEAMLAHHRHLNDGVARRVAAVRSAVEVGGSHEPAVAELVGYVATEVLPHAMAEEHTLYRVGADRHELEATVAEMVDEHRRLVSSVERLASAGEGGDAANTAEAIGSLFAAHVAKENELLLTPLARSDDVDLAGLLVCMHHLTETAQADTSTEVDIATADKPIQRARRDSNPQPSDP